MDLERGLAALERVLVKTPEDDEAQWRALQLFYLRSVGSGAGGVEAVAGACAGLAEHALKRAEASAAAVYYAGVCIGLYAQATASRERVEQVLGVARRASKLDAAVAAGGPERMLGAIYLRAPQWPASVGDVEKAIPHLERAVELGPQWPENHLLLAEAYLEDDRELAAEAALGRAAEGIAAPEHAAWRSEWGAELERLKDEL